MKNKTKKDSEKKSTAKIFFSDAGKYIRQHYKYLLLLFIGFIVVSAVNFVRVSTSQTIASFSLSDFEVGMIADRNIVADRSLPPDEIESVKIEKGEKIIKKGWPITNEDFAKLKKLATSPSYIDYRAFANSELFLLLLALTWYLLFSFIPFHRKITFGEPLLQTILFVFVYTITAFCQKFVIFSTPYSISIVIPSALCIMLVAILYGNLSAVLLSFIISLGVLNVTGWQIETFIFTLTVSLASAGIVRKIERRIDLVLSSLMLSVMEIVFMLINFVIFNDIISELPKLVIGMAINGFLSGILTLGLITPLEIMLNTASVFRLMDLSDLNTPLMKKMLIQASGTYNHSMMVAQLAENACRQIGANALVARVAAYYHDIGKIEQPEYFVENQKGENKHDEINPTLSASVIKSHVRKGIEKGHQMHLPQVVIDIIAEHHGTSVIAYFYNMAKEKDPSLSPEDFSYPGPLPSSKESAVVMLADTVEAACRTLENPSVTRLEKFITTLINAKVEHNQLDNCELTFRDISRIKDSFVQMLAGYYHSRIEYPDQKDPDSNQNNSVQNNTNAQTNTNVQSAASAKKTVTSPTATAPAKKVQSTQSSVRAASASRTGAAQRSSETSVKKSTSAGTKS